MLGKVKDFFNSKWFNPWHKIKIHIAQMILVVVIISLSGAKVATKPSGVPTSRGDTIAITMSAKTIIFLLYQILTSHVSRCKKWASLKAYMILNTLEIVFWFAVIVLTMMGSTRSCKGTSCALGWVVTLVAVFLTLSSFWASVISIKDFRYFKAYGIQRGITLPTQRPYNGYNGNGDDSSTSFQSIRK